MSSKHCNLSDKSVEYFRNLEKIKKSMNDCPHCGAALLLSHVSDYQNFLIQEHARCLDCGKEKKQDVFIIN